MKEEKTCKGAWMGRCKGEITFGPDPYAQEINDDNAEVWMCEECRYQSSMDI